MSKSRLIIIVLSVLILSIFLFGCSQNKDYVSQNTVDDSNGSTNTTPGTNGDTSILPTTGSGDTYYVSTSGSDSTGDGSQTNPWATPGYASRQLQTGDNLIILGGTYILDTYDSDIIIPQNSGTANNPITIKGETGNRPVLAGGDNLLCGIDLSGISNIRIENLEMTHNSSASGSGIYFRDGILIVGSASTNIVLKDLYIHHIDEFGLNFQDIDGLEVTDCTIDYCGYGAIGGPAAGVGGGWKNIVISGCSLSYSGHYYQGGNDARSVYDRPDGIGLEPSNGPIEIKNTTAEHNYGDGLDFKSANVFIHECIVANNYADGVKLWGDGTRVVNTLIYGTGDGVGGASPWAGIVIGTTIQNADFELTNVTVHDNPSRASYPMYVQYDDPTIPITLTMTNCIFSGGQGLIYLAPAVTLAATNNLFNRHNNSTQIQVNGSQLTISELNNLSNCSGNITGDPLFVSEAWGVTGDYNLQSGSPAIDVGTSTNAPSIDLSGSTRPQGSGVDMGCYEN
ncbi:right-handed parallel beta-helix repeat-containing protein [Candidatus Margulisiibacteriota bacterium]